MSDKGTFICYVPKDFSAKDMEVIGKINFILDDMAAKGFPSITVRRVHYEGVKRNWWPNSVANYNKLIRITTEARDAGLVSWTAIEDRGRSLMGINTFDGPADLINDAKSRFALDLWHNQEWRPEVWVEKQGQEGMIGGICNNLRVDFFATKGYNSATEAWRGGRRMARYVAKGQRPIVFYLGDHDPSGLDMVRDVRDRLTLYAGTPIIVVPICLTFQQTQDLALPENPVKVRADGEYSDSRAKAYVEQFGERSWELEALDPSFLAEQIEKHVMQVRDEELWDEALEEEVNDKRRMDDLIKQFGGEPKAEEDDAD